MVGDETNAQALNVQQMGRKLTSRWLKEANWCSLKLLDQIILQDKIPESKNEANRSAADYVGGCDRSRQNVIE